MYGCMYVCIDLCVDVGCSSTKKVNLCFFNENAITDFRKSLSVGSGGTSIHMICRHQMLISNTSFAYLFWLANNKTKKTNKQTNKKANIQS